MCEQLGGKPKLRNESEVGGLASSRDGKGNPTGSKYRHHRPIRILLKDLSESTSVGTRKSVNYAWAE
jgi:hypothetical protein